MARFIRVAALALILATVTGAVTAEGQDAAAWNGYEQWVDMGDGCINYWDGYNYTWSGCMRGDGGFDFYYASYGSWVYSFTTVPSFEGGLWVYVGGTWYYDSPSYGSYGLPGGLYPTSTTIGGASWDGLTGNVLVDQLMINSNNAIIDNILAPYCIETIGNVCYY
jgi:hypothetical protein